MIRINFRKYIKRLFIVSLISIVLVFIVSETAFSFQADRSINRPPEVITIVIPEGTSERILAGEDAPEIPTEMVFVLGDVLEIRNEDVVTHHLGPLYIPPGSSSRLPMGEADNFSLACSFQQNNYLGVDVRQPTTAATKFKAVLTASPPTILFLFLNSLLIFPLDGKKPKKKSESGVKEIE